jgi:hypothetical protein
VSSFTSVVDRAPEIIKAASESNLGILALCCLALAVLAFLFFRGSGTPVKVGIFLLLLIGVAAFSIAMFRVPGSESSNEIPAYTPEFGPAHPSNKSFDQVRSVFAQELARTRLGTSGEIRSKRVADLLDHYVSARRSYYEAFRQVFTHGASATKGSSGGHKRAPMSVSCAQNMTIVDGSVSVTGVGGCYGGTTTATSATGTVSQTGKGRSACTLEITCQLTSDYIDSAVSSEQAALRNLAAE